MPFRNKPPTSAHCNSVTLALLHSKLRDLKRQRIAFQEAGDDEARDAMWEDERGVARQIASLMRSCQSNNRTH